MHRRAEPPRRVSFVALIAVGAGCVIPQGGRARSAQQTPEEERKLSEACLGTATYRGPGAPSGTSLGVHVRNELSSSFVVTRFCLLLDGVPVWNTQDAQSSAQQLEARQTIDWQGSASSGAPHKAAMLVEMQGTGDLSRFRFVMHSTHAFTLAGAGDAVLALDLLERQVVPIEQRPTCDWHEGGAFVAREVPGGAAH